ncbi:Homogentisate 1,2-dioxygenase, N-terminal domain [Dillenia turbinata]|uniref:homogentisate 1,2-dioxygenase n=1 Tax=Dillenia turbinata TaxID=194707 RepID=A0AAN8ZVG0_9MAGN
MVNLRYAANKSMENCSFCNADGDFSIVPQKGRLWVVTECEPLQVSPGEIIVPPQGFRFAINIPDGPSCGANDLAASRDFLAPRAWFERTVLPGYAIMQKYGSELSTAKQDFLPLILLHGTYDLSKFCPYNTVLIDHGDPSINTGWYTLQPLAKADGFLPSGASLHGCMTPHGPDTRTYELYNNLDEVAVKL